MLLARSFTKSNRTKIGVPIGLLVVVNNTAALLSKTDRQSHQDEPNAFLVAHHHCIQGHHLAFTLREELLFPVTFEYVTIMLHNGRLRSHKNLVNTLNPARHPEFTAKHPGLVCISDHVGAPLFKN